MAPSLITTPTPTPTPTSTTQAHGLTTPFIYPPHCSALRDVELHLLYSRSSEATTTATLLVLDPSAVSSSCHPPGWNRPEAREHFAFSGAVCPSNWEAQRVGTWFDFTTAYCCQSDYTLDVPRPWSLMTDNAACYRAQQPTDGPWTATDRWFNSTAVFSGRTDVWDVHAAWHITWAASDTSTLSPQPPEVTEMLATWTPQTTPSMVSTTSATPTPYPPGYKGLTEFFLLTVGVPLLIVGFFVAMCVWAWCCGGKGRKKRDDDVPLESVKREQSAG